MDDVCGGRSPRGNRARLHDVRLVHLRDHDIYWSRRKLAHTPGRRRKWEAVVLVALAAMPLTI